MLINTNQLVSLMDLRKRTGQLVEEASKGKVFYITCRGRIMAMLGPVNHNQQKVKLKYMLVEKNKVSC